MNFVTALAYHFCLALPAALTQPGDHLLAKPCSLKATSDPFQEVHKEVPYQVERRVCPGDADWDDVRDTVGGSFSPSVIADAFNQVIIKLFERG